LNSGKIKAKAKNFWIAISFIIAMTVGFITWSICSTVKHITDQYFKNLADITTAAKAPQQQK
jgi:hypothetical protein